MCGSFAGAIVGAGIVLLFDRPMLYAMDTRADDSKPLAWFAMRVLFILSIATITSERAAPIYMRHELEQQALKDREESQGNRRTELAKQYGLRDLANENDSAGREVTRLETAMNETPAPIATAIASARQCWHRVFERRALLIASGVPRRAAAAAVHPTVTACAAIQREAEAQLARYRQDTARDLEAGRSRASTAASSLSTGRAGLQRRMDEGEKIERQAITADSSSVLWRAMRNPMTAIKFGVAEFLMLILESMPFLFKMYAGRSELGMELGREKRETETGVAERLQDCEDQLAVSRARGRAVADLSAEVLRNESMREFLSVECERQARTTITLEMAVRTLVKAEDTARKMDVVVSRRPSLTSLANELLADALRVVADEPRGARG